MTELYENWIDPWDPEAPVIDGKPEMPVPSYCQTEDDAIDLARLRRQEKEGAIADYFERMDRRAYY